MAKRQLYPITVHYFDGDGAVVWEGTVHHGEDFAPPPLPPGKAKFVRITQADGTFVDEAVELPAKAGSRRMKALAGWAIAAVVALGVVGLVLNDAQQRGARAKHQANCTAAGVVYCPDE